MNDLPQPFLQLSTEHPQQGLAVVRVVGEIDIATAPQLRQHLARAVEEVLQRARNPTPQAAAARPEQQTSGQAGGGAADSDGKTAYVVLDLRAVSFLDSTGVGVLIASQAHARDRAVALRLYRPQPAVTRVLQLTGVEHVLPAQTALPPTTSATPAE